MEEARRERFEARFGREDGAPAAREGSGTPEHLLLGTLDVQQQQAWGATVRGTYPTPEAGTRTQYVLYVGPWGQAALRLRYVASARDRCA